MWWFGFLLCGLLLIVVAIPFFSFPKILTREKKKIKLAEQQIKVVNIPSNNSSNSLPRQQQQGVNQPTQKEASVEKEIKKDSGMAKILKTYPFQCGV